MVDLTERIELLRRALGPGDVWRDGTNVSFQCPSCGKNPEKKKLVVRIDNEMWHCWVCDMKGRSILTLLRKFAKEYSGEWRNRFTTERRNSFEDDEKPAPEPMVLPECMPIDELVGSIDPDARSIVRYLEGRNVSLDKAYRYRLCGGVRGRARGRVVFPSFDFEGKLNYWTARSVRDSNNKYINPKVERRDIIFNEIDIEWSKELVLVEGPFDLLNAGSNATPLLGSFLSRESLLFKRIVESKTPVVLALDSDMEKKSHEIAKSLYAYGASVRIAELGGNKDVGEMTEEEFQSHMSDAKEWKPTDRLTFLIRTISSGSIL